MAIKKTGKKKKLVTETATVRAVTAQGRVLLDNGEKISCSVGRDGPAVKAGDVFVKKDGEWVPSE